MTTTAPMILRCPKCGATVVLSVAARAWCLPCGRPMQPRPATASRHTDQRDRGGAMIVARLRERLDLAARGRSGSRSGTATTAPG